jgi:hypothetical protein
VYPTAVRILVFFDGCIWQCRHKRVWLALRKRSISACPFSDRGPHPTTFLQQVGIWKGSVGDCSWLVFPKSVGI